MTEDLEQLPERQQPVKRKRIYSDESRKNKAAYDRAYRKKKKPEIVEFKRQWHIRNKETSNARNSANYYANKEARRAKAKEYYQRTKPARQAAAKAYYATSGPKIKAAVRDYRLANSESVKASKKAWAKTPTGKLSDLNKLHKRRAAKKATERPVTTCELASIRNAAKGRCHYCRQLKPLTFDHVIPLSKGGSHSAGNLVMACGSCNSSKGAKDPIEFAQSIGLLLV